MIKQRLKEGSRNPLTNNVPVCFFYEFAIRRREHICIRNKSIRDTRITIQVFLEPCSYTTKAIVIRHVESLPKILHHVLAIELRRKNFMLKQIFDFCLLNRVLIILSCNLSIRNSLNSLSTNLALHCLRRSL